MVKSLHQLSNFLAGTVMMMTNARKLMIRLYVVSVVVAALFAGCSKGPLKGVISGSATIDGAPIKNGTIRFIPVDGKSATAGGKIIGGKYTVQTPVNKFKVSINATDDSQSAGPINDNAPLAKNLIPMKYNVRTELVVDIQTGENHKDFALSSR
jgi:hypothetical protein